MKNSIVLFIFCFFICFGDRVNASNVEKQKFIGERPQKTVKYPENKPSLTGKKLRQKQDFQTCTLSIEITVCNNGFCEEGFMYATAPTCQQAGQMLDVALYFMYNPFHF